MRKLIKTIILWIGAIIKHDASPKVVFYHDIGTAYTPMGTDLQVFKEHMKILGVGERGRCREDVICFDDGFRGLWDHREMLREVKAKGEGEKRRVKVFIAVWLVGKPGYLTWDEMRILQNDYGIDFQSHTWSHQTLVGPWNEDDVPREPRTEAWYERELVLSREEIARQLGVGVGCRCSVDELCFPVGYFSDELIERCKKAGYRKVYASYPGNLDEGEGYVQPRCLVQDLSPMGLRAVLSGGMNLFKERYYRRQRIA